MKHWMIVAALVATLTGCKLSGEATGIEREIELQDTLTEQTLVITQDGPFSFSRAYQPGSPYNVVVSNANTQNCRISNGSGVFARAPVTNLRVDCEADDIVCTMEYDPVCGKANAGLVCVTAPCPDHAYQTYSNACVAGAANAQVSFNGTCDKLEDVVTFNDKPVNMVVELQAHPDTRPYTLKGSRIEGDVAYLTLQYSGGCGDHHVNLQVQQTLAAGSPVVANTLLEHLSDDPCDAIITREHSFDLLPVKTFFQRQFNQASGRVAIQNLGNYSF